MIVNQEFRRISCFLGVLYICKEIMTDSQAYLIYNLHHFSLESTKGVKDFTTNHQPAKETITTVMISKRCDTNIFQESIC